MKKSPTPTALEGVTVLDLSRVLAGPWASQLLADLGADVIKIERPGAGDDTRRWGPPFLNDEKDQTNDAAYFLAANRNKKSVAVDIAHPDGAKIVQSLAKKSDILIENFKFGSLKKYRLDYESIKTINPRLVYCSITGFGQTGPYAARPGYDLIIQAMGGLMSVTGQRDGDPGDGPMKVGIAVSDLFSGMYATTSILAALRHAERTGEGQHLDVSLLDCQVAMLANQAMNYLVSGAAPERMGNAHPNIAPYQMFKTANSHIIVAVGNDDQFYNFCMALEVTDLHTDYRFKNNSNRVSNYDALEAILIPILEKEPAAHWLMKLEKAGVPAGPINDIEQIFNDPHIQARDMTVAMSRDDAPNQNYVAHPVKFSKTPSRYDLAPPRLGAQTVEILSTRLSLSDEEIEALTAAGVIAVD